MGNVGTWRGFISPVIINDTTHDLISFLLFNSDHNKTAYRDQCQQHKDIWLLFNRIFTDGVIPIKV